MPLPDDQRKKLDSDLKAHERRLKFLEAEIEATEAEAKVHRLVLRLGSDESLLSALGDLHDDPALAEKASKNPRAFFKQRGVDLPPAAMVQIQSDGTAVRGEFKHGRLKFAATWQKATGFAVTPLEESS